MKAPILTNEAERLENLRQYKILDTSPEHAFDDLTHLAAHICDTPIALISLVDERRQWFKSKVGLTIQETSREQAFCAHAILQSDLFVVPDALADERFATSPLVAAEPHVRFYASAPLITPEGYALGTLCVYDFVPRDLSAAQRKALLALTRQVVSRLELRRASADLTQVNEELSREIAIRSQREEGLRLFKSAVQQANESIVITNSKLDLPGPEIIFVNSAFTRTTGYTAAEVMGLTPRILQGPKTESSVLNQIRQELSQGRSCSGQVINYRKDGTEYYNEWQIAPVRNETGEITHFASIQSDVTERQFMEAKLAEMLAQIERSHDDLLSILNQLSMGTAITDENGQITFVSKAAQSLLGKSEESCLGRPWQQVFSFQEQDMAQLRIMLERPNRLRTKVPVHRETSEGQRYWMEIDVQDNPRKSCKKIFFIYDVTEVHDLRSLLDEKAQFQGLTGKSKSMKFIFQQIQEVAQVDSTVLIEGETGTGKELVARAIHFSSLRKDKPFITVNCAALTDSLLTSQLFGHKRGAFTGAVQDHVGLFEAANSGTLFLDEIGDIPLNVQANLLRALQEREIVRLGESKPRKIDVRILAATNRNLSEEIAAGNFRADLLYRIRVFKIHLPSLRERREDIPLLVVSFLAEFRAITGKPVQEVSNEAMGVLLEHTWPGNVRELKSAIEFAVVRCKGSVIYPEDLPSEIIASSYPQMIDDDRRQDEKQQLLDVLKKAKGNRVVAARLLGISRATFYRRLASLGVTAFHS